MIGIDIVLRLGRRGGSSQRVGRPAPRPAGSQDAEADEEDRLAEAITAKTGTLDTIIAIAGSAADDINRGKGGGLRSINQTGYGPLQFSPIAVSVETKASGDQQTGRLQLGVWTAAWHRRMEAFRHADEHETPRPIVTLPLLLVVGDEWHLFLTCDRPEEGRDEIIGDMNLGKTNKYRC